MINFAHDHHLLDHNRSIQLVQAPSTGSCQPSSMAFTKGVEEDGEGEEESWGPLMGYLLRVT